MKQRNIALSILICSLMFISACSESLSSWHQKNIEKMADFRSGKSSEQQESRPAEGSYNLTFNLDISNNNKNLIRPELLKAATSVIDNLDQYYLQQRTITDEESLNFDYELSSFADIYKGESEFNEDSLNFSEDQVYDLLKKCINDLHDQNIPEYLMNIAAARQYVGIQMSYEHDMKYIEQGVLDQVALKKTRVSLEDSMKYKELAATDYQEARDFLINKIELKLINVQASNEDPTVVKVTYSFQQYDHVNKDNKLSEKTEKFQLTQNYSNPWNPYYEEYKNY